MLGAPLVGWGWLRRPELGKAKGVQTLLGSAGSRYEFPVAEGAGGSVSRERSALLGLEWWLGEKREGSEGRGLTGKTCEMMWNGEAWSLGQVKGFTGERKGVGSDRTQLTDSNLFWTMYQWIDLPHKGIVWNTYHLSLRLTNKPQLSSCLQSLPLFHVSSTYSGFTLI